MIDLTTAAVIAKMASDAVGAFDKVFRGYIDVVKKKEPNAQHLPPPDFAYVDNPREKAFVAQSRRTGEAYQTVTYEQLREKLNEGDRQYIETLTRAMENYQRQWNAAFEQRSMASGMEIGRLDSQLEYLAQQMADPLIRVLEFVEKMGLCLDDHYHMARMITQQYLKDVAG
jgi:hypothetical protein